MSLLADIIGLALRDDDEADIRYTVEYYKDGAKMEEAPAKAITGGAARYGETVTSV